MTKVDAGFAAFEFVNGLTTDPDALVHELIEALGVYADSHPEAAALVRKHLAAADAAGRFGRLCQ